MLFFDIKNHMFFCRVYFFREQLNDVPVLGC